MKAPWLRLLHGVMGALGLAGSAVLIGAPSAPAGARGLWPGWP